MLKKFSYARNLKTPLTVGEIIRECSGVTDTDGLQVMYRTSGPGGEDLLAGCCRHVRGFLVPEDHDIYSMDDEVMRYSFSSEADGKPLLTVWYQSEWIGGSP